MIPVSEAYRLAIKSDERRIKPKVLIYFNGDDLPPDEFDETSVVEIHLLEESSAEADNPLGLVSSNELTVSFRNDDRAFTPSNTESPYYGKLRPNVLLKAFLGVEIYPGMYEWIPLGVFRTADWSAPASTVKATVVCYDKLYELGSKEVPMLPVQYETTVGDLFRLLFEALGLTPTDYSIDPRLKQPVRIGWIPKGKVRDALQVLATAGNCTVNTDRYGRIVVRSNFTTGEAQTILSEDDQLFAVENPQRFLKTFNTVRVNYQLPYLKPETTLLQHDALIVPNGQLTLNEAAFSEGPVAKVNQVRLIGAKNTVVESIRYGAWTITISLYNPGPEETIRLEVLGHSVGLLSSSYTAQDFSAVTEWGVKELTIDNVLIQDPNTAKSYAGALLQLVKDPRGTFNLTLRGDPAVELGDVIQLKDVADKVGVVNVTPLRYTLDYDGALSAKMEARKPIQPYQWVFVSPGLTAFVPYLKVRQLTQWVFISPGLITALPYESL